MNRVQEIRFDLGIMVQQFLGLQKEINQKNEELHQAILEAVDACQDLKTTRWHIRIVPEQIGGYRLEYDGKPGEPKEILELTARPDEWINLGFGMLGFVENRLCAGPALPLSGLVALAQRLKLRVHPESLEQLRAQTEAVFDLLGETALPDLEPQA